MYIYLHGHLVTTVRSNVNCCYFGEVGVVDEG